MQAIILLGGQGSRMDNLTDNKHKSLLPISENETFLSRLLHQINEYAFSNVVIVTGYRQQDINDEIQKYQLNFTVVHNDRFKEDTNIYSMKLALDNVNPNESVIVIEGDIWLEDLALKTIYEESLSQDSVWFTRGRFNSTQYGGILSTSDNGQVVDLKIVKEFETEFSNYNKLVGITTIGANELDAYKELVSKYANKTIAQYYLMPWIDNLEKLPCRGVDIEKYKIESVNTKNEYLTLRNELENLNKVDLSVQLVEVSTLNPIEGYISARADMLFSTIQNSDFWIKPIIVDNKNALILDGHHRFEVAKRLGFKFVPAVLVEYTDIEIWSLRKEEVVTHDLVISRALKADIYPNKTVKHDFKFQLPVCKFSMTELKNKR